MKNPGLVLTVLALAAIAAVTAFWFGGGAAPPAVVGSAGPGTAVLPEDGGGKVEAPAIAGGEPSVDGRVAVAGEPSTAPTAVAGAGVVPLEPGAESAGLLRGRLSGPAGADLGDVLVAAFPADQIGRAALGALYEHLDAARGGDPSSSRRPPLVSALSTDDGRFELALPAGHPTVVVAAVGRDLFTSVPLEARVGEAEISLLCRYGAFVQGIVLPPKGIEGAPLAGLEVVIGMPPGGRSRIDGGGAPARETRTDATGRFEFFAVTPGFEQRVRALSEGFASSSVRIPALEPGEHREAVVSLERGGSVRGRIVDRLGEPIAGADVSLSEDTGFGAGGATLRETTTDGDGWFELSAVPGEGTRGRALAAGHLPLGFDPPPFNSKGVADVGRLELRVGERIAGRLALPDGSPAPGATLEARIDLAKAAGGSRMDLWRGQGGEVESDGDGRFALDGLSGSSFVLEARLELDGDDPRAATLGARHFWVQLEGVQPAEGLAVTLAAAPRLTGTVADVGGRPLPEFTIVAERPSSTPWMLLAAPERFWFQDPGGAFEIGSLSEGTWTLRAKAPGHATSDPVDVELPIDVPVAFALREGVAVAGRVLDPEGLPVSGASVGPDQHWMVELREVDGRRATSIDDGSFLLEDLAPGSLTLEAKHPDWGTSEPLTVDVPVTGRMSGVDLVLRRGGSVAGVVYDDAGEPLAGAQIFCQVTKTFEPVIETSDDEGRFRFDRLAPGTYQVMHMGNMADLIEGGEDATAGFFASLKMAVVDVVDGETAEVTLGAPPSDPVRITGTIVSGGEPVADAVVSFRQESTANESMKLAPVDQAGHFELVLDRPGTFMATVQVGISGLGLRQTNVEFRVEVPEVADYALDLELPAAGIRGRVRDEDGAPLAGVIVSASRQDGVLYGTVFGGGFGITTTDDRGEYEFDHLHSGSYAVTAGGTLFGMSLGSGEVRGRRTRGDLMVGEQGYLTGIDFALPAPSTVIGTVRDADGAPVENASIFARDADGRPLERFSMINSGPSGRFRFEGLAPGDYTFSARTGDRVARDSAQVRVGGAESPTVELELEAGTMVVVRVELDGEPTTAARVTVHDEEGREFSGLLAFNDQMEAFKASFDGGQYRIGPLPAGRYRVAATVPDGRSKDKAVNVGGSAERAVRIRIR